MHVPKELRYTTTHEWARREAQEIIVGITSHAQEELRDIVFIELPKVGKIVKQGEPVAVVESVKAAFDIYTPVSGTVTRVNEAVTASPQLLNQDCYGEGWLFAMAPSAPAEFDRLASAEAYLKQIEAQAH
jgi:glycine cleavage system H protein